MNLSLKPDVEQFIDTKVQTGEYARAEDVVEAGVIALQQQETAPLGQPILGQTPTPHRTPTLSEVVVTVPRVAAPAVVKGTGDQMPLFERPEQPWTAKRPPQLSNERYQERKALLDSLALVAESRLGNTEQRVAYLLQRYPETRDSDTALAIRYWRIFQPNILEKWDRLDLEILYELDPMGTISRLRRHIQHDLFLYAASGFARQMRDEMQIEFNQYMAARSHDAPEVRFYLDETGNEPSKTYSGIAGICVLEWRQYEKYWASLAKWRQEQGWPETIHFAETGSMLQPKALALLNQLQTRRAGLLFVGYAMSSRGRTHEAIFSLFIQLIVDSLHQLDALNCLSNVRGISLIKEAEMGFDSLYSTTLRKNLEEVLAREFPNRVFVQDVMSIPKGREVFLECADLIAGAMQRRALFGGQNPKDELAEAVFNVTGFEDPRDNGTVFKAYLK